MSYPCILASLGFTLVILGAVESGWAVIAVWLGCNFLVLAVAHSRGVHRIFGKKSDGVLPVWSWLLFLPLLAFTSAVWHLLRVVSKEPAQNAVTEQLVVGRRLLSIEFETEFDNYIDLTAEFSEPSAIRTSLGYRSFPILDSGTPSLESLRAAVGNLRPGRTYVHCAQGHGRTGLFAVAVLLNSGAANSVEMGLQMLHRARPGIRLNRAQRECLQRYAEQESRNEINAS